ncbi:MAG: class I SAM-dependent methyltransferase [Methylovirgula sp.]|uniref:class I SAM-dependent methyltransferase n=1 Tax=Methylovirgula sp. TaxID=1978224 RepID=UPI0030760195
MTMAKGHATLVTNQFGSRADAYVESSVHAQGADLDQAAVLLEGAGDTRVLDLGCGGGHVAFRAAPLVRDVVAYDLSTDMLAAVARTAAQRGLTNIATRQGSAEALPFDEADFDFVLSRYSAHHWHGFHRALVEAHRVLRPGGRALFMDAISPGIALLDTYLQTVELLRDPSHVRDYSAAEWVNALAGAGFAVKSVTTRRLRLDFKTWIARMATPDAQAAAIRALQTQMSEDIAQHFAIESDGSFTIDTASFEVSRDA